MEIIHNYYSSKNGQLIIDLPPSFSKEVEVIIIPKRKKKTEIQIPDELNRFFDKYQIDLSNFKFNREEANER